MISRGITLEGLKDMTLGQAVDYVVTWNKMHNPDDTEQKSKPTRRKASQADWDAFLA